MNLYGGLILGVNTLYRLFCFFKPFLMVSKGLTRLDSFSVRGCSSVDIRSSVG